VIQPVAAFKTKRKKNDKVLHVLHFTELKLKVRGDKHGNSVTVSSIWFSHLSISYSGKFDLRQTK